MSRTGLGDFQTPLELAAAVWEKVDVGKYQTVIEPTVGSGSFVAAAPPAAATRQWFCFDLDRTYVKQTKAITKQRDINAQVSVKNAFTLTAKDFAGLAPDSSILAIGNPPWVTSAALGKSGFDNLPTRLKNTGLKGLDAVTGKSNFDIAEVILLNLLGSLQSFRQVDFVFLLKKSVALRLGQKFLATPGISDYSTDWIDAKAHWGVEVDACIFKFSYQRDDPSKLTQIHMTDNQGALSRAGSGKGGFVYNLEGYRYELEQDPESRQMTWRQGLKHDVASVLELEITDEGLRNKHGEAVQIEDSLLHPWYKSTDIARDKPYRHVFPLYQHDLKGPLDLADYPQLLTYLESNQSSFTARKSSIYHNKYDYMLFGVGDYTLAPYKVAVSGLHRVPVFRALAPVEGKAPLLDDTCYFLACTSALQAKRLAAYLNSDPVQLFIASLANPGAKRPYTKELLSRVHLPASFSKPLKEAVAANDEGKLLRAL